MRLLCLKDEYDVFFQPSSDMVWLARRSCCMSAIQCRKSEMLCFNSVCRVHLCAGEDEDQFEQFMLPLTAAFEAVAQMLSTNTFNEQEAKVTHTRLYSCTCGDSH